MSSLLARLALHAALLGFSSCVALGAAELTVRAILPQYISIQTDRAIWQHHPQLGWVGRSGADVFQGFDDAQKVSVRINSVGFREDEIPAAKPEGKQRVLVLGDSVAFGFGARLEDRFSEVLERSRSDLELVNLGVSGYSTDQELLLFRELGVGYEPDIVVCLFVANDVHYNGRPLGHGHPKPALRFEGNALRVANVPVPETGWALRVKYALQRNSALFNLARERFRSLARETGVNRLAGDEMLAGESDAGPVADDPLELTRRLLTRMREEVDASGARFLLMIATTDAALERNGRVNVELGSWCRETGLPCLDTYPAFRSYADAHPDAVLFLQDRSHWSALGHTLAARALLGELVDRGWVPPAAPSG